MKILSNEDIKTIRRLTMEAQGITSVDLVERTGEAVAEEVMAVAGRPDEGRPLLVLAGWGDNGAEALATARVLAEQGYKPEVLLFNIGGNRLSPECTVMRDRLDGVEGVMLQEITGNEPFRWTDPSVSSVIVDGLFGGGHDKPMPRTFQLLARNINDSGATVVSIDIPSGLSEEWNGKVSREYMIHATITVAIEFPRLSFMLADNADVVGHWKIVRIGYDSNAIRQAPFTFVLVDKPLVARCLKPRKPFSSKHDYGNAMIFAGSRGMAGAAVLAARGALRAGAGRVTVHGPAENMIVLQTAVPEAMFRADQRAAYISSMFFDLKYNSYAVGPGIGKAEETAIAFEKFIKAAQAAGRRLVLDADALNIIAKRPILLNYITPFSVITPHIDEFDRIFGASANSEERLRKALKCAEDYSLIIVLKGHHTAIIRPDGKLMFNSSGTPAMATPGSGDVLTGVITALMANGLVSEIAAFVGPYIHGVAGELAAKQHGEYGVTAGDIADNIGAAIKEIM